MSVQAPLMRSIDPVALSLTIPAYEFEFDVHIFDTDCYGVMWHGAYAKWLEMGRVDIFKHIGLNVKEMSDHFNIIFPVVEQNVRFKASARFGDRVKLSTQFTLDGYKFNFDQVVTDAKTGKAYIEAKTVVVMVNSEGKMYRTVPEIITERVNVVLNSD